MKRDLQTILSDIEAGRAPRFLLVFGDDLQVAESCTAIVDRLVPIDQRGFNLERFDGRAVSWEQIENSVMTPPFFPGTKLLWVDGATYFYAREQSGEFSEKALDLWREGKRDDATKLLLDLLVLEGWNQDRWDNLDSVAPLVALLGAETGEDQEVVQALFTFCKSRSMDFARRKGAEANRLSALLDDGLPEWSFLLLTAVQVDRRTRLFKRFEETKAVLHLAVERDKTGRISRESLLDFVGRQLRQAGKQIEPRAREMILSRAGDNLRGLQQELEKLVLFVGDRPAIRAEDVDMMFTDCGEGWIFDLTRALCERDALAAIRQLSRLMAQGDHPLKILGAVAAEARRLLAARQLLAGELAKSWRRGMSYTQFQQVVAKLGISTPGRNLFGDYMCVQRAERFSLAELRSFMENIFETDVRLKSSSINGQLALEKLFLDMCLGCGKIAHSASARV